MANWLKMIRDALPSGYEAEGCNKFYSVWKSGDRRAFAIICVRPARHFTALEKSVWVSDRVVDCVDALGRVA